MYRSLSACVCVTSIDRFQGVIKPLMGIATGLVAGLITTQSLSFDHILRQNTLHISKDQSLENYHDEVSSLFDSSE